MLFFFYTYSTLDWLQFLFPPQIPAENRSSCLCRDEDQLVCDSLSLGGAVWTVCTTGWPLKKKDVLLACIFLCVTEMDFDSCPLKMRWSGLGTCFVLVLLGDWSHDHLTEKGYICTSAVNLLVCKVTKNSPEWQKRPLFICQLTANFTVHNYCPNLRAVFFFF